MVFTADAGGRCEVFAWDAAARRARQVTDRPGGTLHCAVDAESYVWWFEEDSDGRGHWWYQHFEGGPRLPGLPGAPAGLPRGLAVTPHGTVAAAVADAHGTAVLLGRRGRAPREVLRTPGPRRLGGLAPTGDLLAVAAAPDDPAAVTLLGADGDVRARLPGPDGPSGRLWCASFAPRSGAPELLLVRDLGDRYAPATWTADRGLRTHAWCSFDTEITARWYPDGRGLLIRQERHGRSLLHRVDLAARTRTLLPTRPGTLLDAAPRPDGALHQLWTDTGHSPAPLTSGAVPLPPPGQTTTVPGRHTELWTPTPDGPVHTFLSLPEGDDNLPDREGGLPQGDDNLPDREGGLPQRDGPAPPPAIFLVHGGPADQDRDAYDGVVHSLVASGYAVVRVNYRGSTGYGPRWRDAFTAGVGHTQVQDLTIVRAELVRRGLVDADAIGLWGMSWGAYLVLLALGTRPGLWRAGVAVKPVADWAAAHRTTTPALRALDVRLFGGTPEEVPERYAASSPIGYAAHVRAPLLVVGARRDVKCPPEQIRSYLAALTEAGAPHEEMWLDTGHDGYDGADHVAVLRRALRFMSAHLPGPRRRTAATTRPPAPLGGSRPR
nr:alpha/beta fold hydrolase [Streptomyces mangrovisoli]